jgi:hypothetical protein
MVRHAAAWITVLVLMLWGASVRAAEAPTAPAFKVQFLDAEAARKAIVDDAAEPYFSAMMPREMAARTGAPMPEGTLAEQRAECRRRYQAAAMEFTPQEQDAVRWYAAGLSKVLDGNYPLLARTPWSFLKVGDAIEGGMPWTRGDDIVLPAHLVRGLVAAQAGSRTRNTLVAGQLLVHEQVHVVQRRHPGIFDSLYKGRWGFLHPDRLEGNAWLQERQILNPDAPDLRWVFPVHTGDEVSYIWPRVILRDRAGTPQLPGDMWAVAVSVEPAGEAGSEGAVDGSAGSRDVAAGRAGREASAARTAPAEPAFRVVTDAAGKPVLQDLDSVKPYAEALAPSTYTIHPNEASADLFCGLMVFDDFIPHDRLPAGYVESTEKELAPYRAYFRAQLKEPADRQPTTGN